ncbi:MAG TPA: AsmA-like C-terminal domain-containing protein [Terriglobales bacterium]|nr:AsmA-like C-terminal domain-containing protein [Terriglobales bacterium]
MKLPRPSILFAVLAAIVSVLVVFGVLLLPRLIDSQGIKERIATALADKGQAKVTVNKIVILWFPRPHLVIEDATVSMGEPVQASIQRVEIYPSFFYLLTGRWVVRRARLQEPKLRIHLPENSTIPIDLEVLENQIRAALDGFTSKLPAPRIDLADGSAEILLGDKPPVYLQNIAAESAVSSEELNLEFSARSSLWKRLTIKGRIAPKTLAARLNISIERFRLKDSIALMPHSIFQDVAGEANFDVNISAAGLRQVKASIGGFTGPVTLRRQGRTTTVKVNRLKGGIAYADGDFQADVEQLDLAAPRLRASGQLKMRSGLLAATVKARDIDIAEMGGMALEIFGETEDVKTMLRYLPAGSIPAVTIETAGRSFGDLATSKNVVLSGELRNGRVVVPGVHLELRNVAGSVRMSAGILEAQNASAHLGTMRAWDGALRLGLDGKESAPFHLAVSLQAGAGELHSMLLKIVPDGRLRRELLKVRRIAGQLSGRVTLGETIAAMAPVVTITKADLAATYEPLPFPIVIRGARINYDAKTIGLDNAQASVGRSSFGGLGVTWHHDGSREIKVAAKQIFLDLQQSDTLIRAFQEKPAALTFMRGDVELQNVALSGAFDDPIEWTFSGTGALHQVEIGHGDLPDRLILSRGKFAAQQKRWLFSDVAAAMSDAAFVGAGRVDYNSGGPAEIEATGSATIGRQMTQWLGRYADLPEEVKLRSPLQISDGRIGWRADGYNSFRGAVTAARGPVMTVEAVKSQQALAVKTLAIDDGDRHAQIALQLAKGHLEGSFKGEITQETIDKIFTSFPTKVGSLRGDFHISGALAEPGSFSARGQLSGTHLDVRWGTEQIALDQFSIESNDGPLMVRSAALRWRNSRLSIAGNISPGRDAWRFDLDVSGDRLSWDELDQVFGKGGEKSKKVSGDFALPRLEGTIRLTLDSFATERMSLSGLRVRTALSSGVIQAEIESAGVCGMNTTGHLDVVDKNLEFDVQLSATDAQLEPTTVCLSNRQNDIKGLYSLTARLAGRGTLDDLLRSLKGNFEFRARNGEFVRSPGIDATFDYLNATGDFKVAFPDLDKETFPYQFIGVKGRIEGEVLIGDEVNIESALLNLTGQGRVNLERKEIDGKGLIAVLKPVSDVVRRIPVIGSMLGGSLVGIPVRISGGLERPNITYLSPADIGTDLLNIPVRILGVPLEAIKLFNPSEGSGDKSISQ